MSPAGNSSREHGKEAGYTLLEVMVVLAILAMVAGVVPAMIRDASPHLRLKAAAGETMKDLAYLRARARLEGTPRSLLASEDGRGYRFEPGQRGVTFAENVSVALGVDEKAFVVVPGSAITFYPEGGSSGGQVVLSSGDATETIHVDWLTGAISRNNPS